RRSAHAHGVVPRRPRGRDLDDLRRGRRARDQRRHLVAGRRCICDAAAPFPRLTWRSPETPRAQALWHDPAVNPLDLVAIALLVLAVALGVRSGALPQILGLAGAAVAALSGLAILATGAPL